MQASQLPPADHLPVDIPIQFQILASAVHLPVCPIIYDCPGIFKNKTLSLIFKILGFVIVVAGIIDLLKAFGIF